MPIRNVKFILTQKSAKEFQAALDNLNDLKSDSNGAVVDVRMGSKTVDGVKVPVGVIVVEI